MKEDKQAICNALCECLRLTSAAGTSNALKRFEYIDDGLGTEIVRPVFENGAGKDGWYDVNVSCDSGIAMISDIVKQFVNRVW